MNKQRPATCPERSQAVLLHHRGELKGGRGHFNVDLPKASPIARRIKDGSEISRLGMDVQRSGQGQRLVVAEIDVNQRHRSPVARWNLEEVRQSDRGENEVHACLAIKPGDRIKAVLDFQGNDLARAVNGFATMSQTEMLAELAKATKPESPRNLSLMVSRDIADIMAPAQPLQGAPKAPCVKTPPKMPRPRSSTSAPHLHAVAAEVCCKGSSPQLRTPQNRAVSPILSTASTRASTPTHAPRLSSRPSSSNSAKRSAIVINEIAMKPRQRCSSLGALSCAGRSTICA